MTTPASQVQLTIVEDVLGELILLDAPATQVVVGTDLSDTEPLPIGTAAAGTSIDGARADHVHAHGNQLGGSLHAAATTSAAGFMSGTDKTKIDNATASGTANTLVRRDASGDFEANQITAELVGNSATATKLATARTINGESFDGSANITLTAVPNASSVVDASVASNAAIALSKLATGALPTAITVESANIVNGTIVDADVNATAAIAGTKIVPQFGAQAMDANSLASLANLMFAFAARGSSIGEPGKLLFGVGPAVTGTTPVGIGPHDYYPIDLATGSFM
jgi:hypothetical protein